MKASFQTLIIIETLIITYIFQGHFIQFFKDLAFKSLN